MKKVISFSLWGDTSASINVYSNCTLNDYFIGAIKNAELALEIYPDFECWFYVHKETVPDEIIDKLNKISNTKIIYKTGDLNKLKPMTWRFESIDHPEALNTGTALLKRLQTQKNPFSSVDRQDEGLKRGRVEGRKEQHFAGSGMAFWAKKVFSPFPRPEAPTEHLCICQTLHISLRQARTL